MNESTTRQRSGKALLIAQITVVLALALLVAAYFTLLSTGLNEYTIYDGDQVLTLSSESTDIEEVLAEGLHAVHALHGHAGMVCAYVTAITESANCITGTGSAMFAARYHHCSQKNVAATHSKLAAMPIRFTGRSPSCRMSDRLEMHRATENASTGVSSR